MTRSILLPILIVFAVLVQAKAQQRVLPPLVSVTGTGEVRVQPDQVVLSMGVEIREKTLEQARKQADAKAAAIIAYLKKKGIEAKDIQTSYMNINPMYDGSSFNRTTPDFYLAQKTMTVLIRNLNRFDELTTGLYEAGINRIDGISFQVASIEKHKEEAQKRAIQQAKQKAQILTSQLGSKVGNVYSINEVSSGMPRPYQSKMMMQEAATMDSNSGPTIAGGEIIITSQVEVSFIIE
jgi:uncharacterized protein